MAKMTYAEKLKDPRWQRKRLEILERDDWACQWCGDNTSELHVHHLIYHWDSEPWEYQDEELITLCSSCHEKEKDRKLAIERLTHALTVRWRLSAEDLDHLAKHFEDMADSGVADPYYIHMNCHISIIGKISRYAEITKASLTEGENTKDGRLVQIASSAAR